ncbi:hypothetical protein BH24ACT20_BH24ACT20_09340 [soil metagenome]|jgi:LAS superfamily LD-carboxypeptidase LdcB
MCRASSFAGLACGDDVFLFLSTSVRAKELPEGDCEDPLVLVDKGHSLGPTYTPPDLAFLADYGVPVLDWNGMLREEAAEHIAELDSAAGSEGLELAIASAPRSYYDQFLAHFLLPKSLRRRGGSRQRRARPQ